MIDYVLGDLREEYGILCAERGVPKARRWYARPRASSYPASAALKT